MLDVNTLQAKAFIQNTQILNAFKVERRFMNMNGLHNVFTAH